MERLNKEFPTTLKFDESDEFIGKFDRLEASPEHPEYGVTPIMVLIGESGKVAGTKIEKGKEYGVWLMHHTLRVSATDQRPSKGETVGIVYRGKRQSEGGKAYHDWRLIVDREVKPNEEMSWENIAKQID